MAYLAYLLYSSLAKKLRLKGIIKITTNWNSYYTDYAFSETVGGRRHFAVC